MNSSSLIVWSLFSNLTRYFLFLVTLFAFSSSFSQSETSYNGVKWVEGLTWSQIKQKANAENKFIFVDCYATWCGPCKMMDKEVYPNDSVGKYLNERFISVRIQFDSTKTDSKEIQDHYSLAVELRRDFKVFAFPTFLFFSPEAIPLHKEMGYREKGEFINMAAVVDSVERQYYSLKTAWKSNMLSINKYPILATMAKSMGDGDTALLIAKDYMQLYLNSLNDSDFLLKKNLLFISDYKAMLHTKDRIFNFYYHHPSVINNIMGDSNYAFYMANTVIRNDELEPALHEARTTKKNPYWNLIKRKIKKKYGIARANLIINNAKLSFYKASNSWENYTKCLIENIEGRLKTLPAKDLGFFFLNNVAWEIFCYSNKKKELKKALNLCSIAIPLTPEELRIAIIDTKANLLYKMGKVKDAIGLEETALKERIEIAVKANKKYNGDLYQKVIDKMKGGEKTWIWPEYLK